MSEKNTGLSAVVALVAVFTLAVTFIIIGAISEELKAALGINNSQIGTMVMVFFLTNVVIQLIVGPLVDKFGHKPIAVLGFVVTALSMLLLAYARSFGLVLLSCVLLGLGAMSLNTVGNTLIPVVLFGGKDPARASNLGNAFFGLGYVLTPLIFVFFLRSLGLSYSAALTIIALVVLAFLILALVANYPAVSTGFQLSMAVKLLTEGAVLIAAIALFAYISLEITMATWIKPLMTELYESVGATNAVAKAGVVLSLFGVAMMIGRFLSSLVRNLTAIGTKVIAATSLISVVTILVLARTSSPGLAIAMIILTGLVFAPIFPTVVGVTFAKFEPRLFGSVFGIIFAVGLLGGTFIPKLIGSVSVGRTVQQSMPIAALMAAILFVIALFIGKVKGPAQAGEAEEAA